MSEHSCVWFLFIYILSGHANRWLKVYTSAATEAADIFHVLFPSEQLVRRMFKLSFKLKSPKLHRADIVLSRAKKRAAKLVVRRCGEMEPQTFRSY